MDRPRFEETGLLIKHGLCHIDTEGGLVHLANAVHASLCGSIRPHAGRVFRLPAKHQFGAVGLQSLLVRHPKLAHRVSAAHERSGMHEGALRRQRGGRREQDHRGVGKPFREADRGRNSILADAVGRNGREGAGLLEP